MGNNIHWCSKNFLSLPKSAGGLGIRNVECLNQALLAKHGWRLVSEENSLFCRIFMQKLFGSQVFHNDMHPISGTGRSWGIRSILHWLSFVLENIGWKIGTDSKLNVWTSRWVGGKQPESKDLWLDLTNSHLARLQVRDLFHPDGKWNAAFIDAVFKDEWSTRILAIPSCEVRLRDKVFWPFTKNGTFTVKSGYELIFNRYMAIRGTSKDKSRINDRGREFCRKTLWNLPVPVVWKILIWKIIIKALPTGSELHKRKLDVEPFCGMCGGDQKCFESLEHLFRDCSLVQRLWAGSDLGIRVESAEGLSVSKWIYDWMRYLSKSEGGEDKMITFVAILWGVWSLRNKVIFQELDLNPYTITGCFFSSIRKNVQVLCSSQLTKQPLSMQQSSEEGSTQEDREAIRNGHPVNLIGNHNNCGVVRVKVDASWLRNFEATIGWVAFDHTGREIVRRQVRTRAESALQAEALGVRDVLLWAQEQRILHVDLSSDCLQFINQVAGIDQEDHMIAGILEDVRDRFSFFHCLSLNFIPRRLNNIVHGLAKQALRL